LAIFEKKLLALLKRFVERTKVEKVDKRDVFVSSEKRGKNF
jgi:hypothetical protein